MIYTYNVLKSVIDTGKPIVINDQSQIKKMDTKQIEAISFISKLRNERDYYAFLELNPGKGIVFYSDGNSFDGFTIFEIPLSEFYFEVNTDKGIIDIEDGVGNQTDFLDLFTGPVIEDLTRKYSNAADEEIIQSNEYQMADRYISVYLGYDGEDEKRINLTLLKFAMAIYIDQNESKQS
jgi:hypothetical protein